VASQTQLGSLQASNPMRIEIPIDGKTNLIRPTKASVELPSANPLPADPGCEPEIPQVFAQGAEFVALPGESERLEWEIPLLMRAANGESSGFFGCIVLFSEEEARLVTVITLWAGREQAKNCDEKRLKRLLEPYVDRWLRLRRFVGFFPSIGNS
jgi:hypothetical protein